MSAVFGCKSSLSMSQRERPGQIARERDREKQCSACVPCAVSFFGKLCC